MDMRTVFDIHEDGLRFWWFPVAGLVFILISLYLHKVRHIIPSFFWRAGPEGRTVFTVLAVGFSFIWTALAFTIYVGDYVTSVRALDLGQVTVTEGYVTYFKPGAYSGRGDEEFCVRNTCFHYAASRLTAGFNQTTAHGGPITLNLPVRVAHVGNTILKLEVGE